MRLSGALLLLLLVAAPVYAAAEAGSETVAAGAETKKAPRLKYRTGPVCMCANGLSEEDIRRAEEQRKKAKKSAEPRK